VIDYEFYETAEAFMRCLVNVLGRRCNGGLTGRNCFEPCVGNGAIVRAAGVGEWDTNDLDSRWPASTHVSATCASTFERFKPIDWTVSNTPFTYAIPIASQALAASRIGVALYLRVSIHEVLKEGVRRAWFAQHPPTGIVFLPRFAHQRSRAKGIWSTDSMTSCWVIWHKGTTAQFIEYAPESVLDELEAETPHYREQMDALNGLTGSEKDRQEQWKARWASSGESVPA
jgi:hypothetical protein